MAEPMYPSEVNAGVREMMFGNEQPQSQPDAPSWSMGNDYSPSRFENGFYNRFQSTNNRNQVRSGLNMGIRQGIDVGTLRKTIEEQKQTYDQLDQEYNNPINVDRSRLMGLQNQYATNMANAPMMQAPVQPQVNDTVAGVSALAALLSPQQMRGRIAMAPFQAAQMSADRQNQQNQQQYAIESQNFGTVMKGLAAQIDQEAEQVKNLYGVDVDKKELLRKRMNDIMDSVTQTQGQIVGAEKAYDANTIRRHTAATNEWKNAIAQAQLDGEVTQDEYDQLAALLPNFLESRGIPVELADTYVMPTVGKSQSRMGMDFSQGQATAKVEALKATQTWKNAKELFDMRLKQVNMSGQVTEADRKALLPLAQKLFPESPESLLPQVGEDWKKLQGQQRLNKPTGTGSRGGGGGRGRGGSPKALDGNLGGDPPAISKKEASGKVARAVGAIKKLEAMIKAQGDPKKRAQMEIQLKGYQATRDYYASMVKGEVKPFEPPPPNTDIKPYWDAVNQIVQSGKDLMGKGEKVGIPLGNSYAEGGDKTQYGTQNPQAQTKPAKSPQNAGKAPPPPKQFNIGGKTFKKTS